MPPKRIDWIVVLMFVAITLLIAFVAMNAVAQELPSAPTVNKTFAVLSAATFGTAHFDAWTTTRNLDLQGYHESNVILGSHPSSTKVYGYLYGTAAATNVLSGYLKKRHSRFWWLPQVASIGGHTIAGIHNLSIHDSTRQHR